MGKNEFFALGQKTLCHNPSSRIEFLTKERAMVVEPFKVLIMEDNDLVSRFYKTMFRDEPWDVTLVENGTKALKAFKEARDSGHSYDVVILDLDINGDRMAGLRVFEQLKLLDGNVKAILCSGSIDDAVYRKCAEVGFRATLRKPFEVSTLQSLMLSVIPV